MKRTIFLLLVPLLALLAISVRQGDSKAEAAPVGAATGQTVLQQNCQADGLVHVRFVWTPSVLGNQFVDVSKLNNNFAFGFVGLGPLAAGANSFDWFGLEPNTVYFSRVNTFTQIGWLASDTIVFVTPFCGPTQFSPPDDLSEVVIDGDSVRFRWDRGQNNLFFCVDTALNQSDLTNFRGSWMNWGCGTTATTLQVDGLLCGQQYFWRVWAAGNFNSGHSGIETFATPTCNFTPPTNPTSSNITGTSAHLSWTRGDNNLFYCLDIALTPTDLQNLTGSWINIGCGRTVAEIDISGLSCGTAYHWRAWAAGPGTSGYTPIATFTTSPCGFSPPTNLRESNITMNSARLRWDAGNQNRVYCIDTAKTERDLLLFGATWSNHNCPTENTSIDLTGLECDTTYFWRVYAVGGGTSGYSAVQSFKTSSCT